MSNCFSSHRPEWGIVDRGCWKSLKYCPVVLRKHCKASTHRVELTLRSMSTFEWRNLSSSVRWLPSRWMRRSEGNDGEQHCGPIRACPSISSTILVAVEIGSIDINKFHTPNAARADNCTSPPQAKRPDPPKTLWSSGTIYRSIDVPIARR